MIFLADRNTAGGDDQVVIGSGRTQRSARGFELVGYQPKVAHFAAETFKQRHQRKTVGVVDGPRRQRLAGHAQFITGEEYRHAHTAQHRQRSQPDRGGKGGVLRPQAGAGGEDLRARRDVFTSTTNVFARLRHVIDRHTLAGVLATFLHDHRVSAGRDRCAGEDAGGRTRLQVGADGAGRNALRHRQCRTDGSDISGTHRVAIHRRVVERRH